MQGQAEKTTRTEQCGSSLQVESGEAVPVSHDHKRHQPSAPGSEGLSMGISARPSAQGHKEEIRVLAPVGAQLEALRENLL